MTSTDLESLPWDVRCVFFCAQQDGKCVLALCVCYFSFSDVHLLCNDSYFGDGTNK